MLLTITPIRVVLGMTSFNQGVELSSSCRTTEGARMQTPPIVSADEWKAAYEDMLVKEKELTRTRVALAAMRRRMPWTLVERPYEFESADGTLSLLDLFAGRRQLLVYRAFMDPGLHGWPDHGCVGCSLMADNIGNLAHLNAPDTTLVYVSRASQADLLR